ncbi:MAG: hypothetical protein U5R48_18125 [Gammaproteobacteria bacterium]|nr:hypothetical protein [Gammaproteobacteria bacterium]
MLPTGHLDLLVSDGELIRVDAARPAHARHPGPETGGARAIAWTTGVRCWPCSPAAPAAFITSAFFPDRGDSRCSAIAASNLMYYSHPWTLHTLGPLIDDPSRSVLIELAETSMLEILAPIRHAGAAVRCTCARPLRVDAACARDDHAARRGTRDVGTQSARTPDRLIDALRILDVIETGLDRVLLLASAMPGSSGRCCRWWTGSTSSSTVPIPRTRPCATAPGCWPRTARWNPGAGAACTSTTTGSAPARAARSTARCSRIAATGV